MPRSVAGSSSRSVGCAAISFREKSVPRREEVEDDPQRLPPPLHAQLGEAARPSKDVDSFSFVPVVGKFNFGALGELQSVEPAQLSLAGLGPSQLADALTLKFSEGYFAECDKIGKGASRDAYLLRKEPQIGRAHV